MRVAVAQLEPALGENEQNLRSASGVSRRRPRPVRELLVLPECAIPGYVFDSLEEALPFAEEIPGPSTEALEREACRGSGTHVVCGLLERDGDRLRNAAVLVGPGRADRHVPQDAPAVPRGRPLRHAGDELPVYDTPLGRIGVEICYDLRFPEVTRRSRSRARTSSPTRPTSRSRHGSRPS